MSVSIHDIVLSLCYIDAGLVRINLLDGNCFEEMNSNHFAVHDVASTCMIKTFMGGREDYKKTYKPFKGNTYYEFVEDIDEHHHEVILMYMVCALNWQYLIYRI